MKDKILEFIYGAFWAKFTLLVIAAILSFFVWEGAVFVFLMLYFVSWFPYNIYKNKPKNL